MITNPNTQMQGLSVFRENDILMALLVTKHLLGLDTLRDNNTLMLLLVPQHNTTSLALLLLLITNPLLAYKS